MALTRAGLKEMLNEAGVDREHMAEAVTAIIEAHTATVDALKEQIRTLGETNADLEKSAKGYRETATALTKERDTANKDLTKVRKDLETAQSEARAATQRAEAAERDRDAFKEEAEKAGSERDANAAALETSKRDADDAKAQIAAMTERAEKAEAERDTLKETAAKLEAAETELSALKAGDWETKYNSDHEALETLRGEVAARDAQAKREAAARKYFAGKSIVGTSLEIAMLGGKSEIAALELDEQGNIKDTTALDGLVSGTLAPLVSQTATIPTHTPPEATGTPATVTVTADEIMKIENAEERQAAIAEHPEAFGYGG